MARRGGLLLGLLLLLAAAAGPGARAQCGDVEEDLAVRGDAVVTALLPLQAGPGCAADVPRGRRLAAAAMHVLAALRRHQYVPDVDVGLRIVNSCDSPSVARKVLVGAFVDLDCERLYSLGVLAGEDLSRSESVSELCAGLTQALWTLPESPEPEPQYGNALGTLLAAGPWPAADILTSSVHSDDDDEKDDGDDGVPEHQLDAAEQLADQAVENARLRGVCARRGHAPDGFRWSGPASRARVLVGAEAALRRMLRQHVLVPVEGPGSATPGPQLVLAPPDGVWSASTPLPRDALVLVPDPSPLRALMERLGEQARNLSDDAVAVPFPPDPEDVAAAVGLNDLVAVGRALIRAADLLKEGVGAFCDGEPAADENTTSTDAGGGSSASGPEEAQRQVCARLPATGLLLEELRASLPPQPQDEAVERLLEVRPDEVASRAAATAAYLLLRSPGPGRPLVPLARYRGGIWTIPDDALTKTDPETVDCPLLLASGEVEWVREAWVATVLTVAVLGTMCATAVAFFIATRILAGDILEGSATLSLLLLLAVLLAFASALPYCARGSGLVLCGLRLLAAPLAHSLLLSVMLGRALMLAACDHDGGLLSHVSGPLQAALCFFTLAVQVALSVQLGLLLSPAVCGWLSGPRFLILLSYDLLLLALLAVTAPFIATSRRNYREGMFFAATTVVLLALWIAWVSLYLAGGHAWRDAAMSGGVTAAAAAVLLGVFVPRTYLMAGAMVRDKLAAQLPAFARDHSITDLAFREVARGTGAAGAMMLGAGAGGGPGAALYDSVSLSGGGPCGSVSGSRGGRLARAAAASPNVYSDSYRHGHRTRPTTPLSPEGSLPRYDVPSPHKVTRF
ncbi:Protein bride of sevenless [Frankliniella fusca]|uniref:Protein bride of sevenless n=1 Tax=Frankliniella fusca TaxID=407009 RepID=A0AAE1HHP8_9NEOP|nr:Protein bride of sevenless [Frankliniella fusca]